MRQEIWKPIKGYEGYYEVSDLGRIRSLDRLVKGVRYAKDYQFVLKGKLKTMSLNHKGYYRVSLTDKNGIEKSHFVHRIVAETFIGDIYKKEIDHINTIRTDNRAENLKIVTSKENSNNPITREKKRKSHLKPVKCTLKDGTVLVFNSINEASEYEGRAACSISKYLNNTVINPRGNKWEYI